MAHTPPQPVPDDRERGLEHTGPGEVSMNGSPFTPAQLSWDGSTLSIHDPQGTLIFSASRSSLSRIEQHGTTLRLVTVEGTLALRFGTAAGRIGLAVEQHPGVEDSLEVAGLGNSVDYDQHIEERDYQAISSSEYGVWYGIFAQILIDDGKMIPARNDLATYGLSRWGSGLRLSGANSSTLVITLLVLLVILYLLFFAHIPL